MKRTNTQKSFERQASKKLRLNKTQSFLYSVAMGRPILNLPEPGSQAYRARKLREAMGFQTQKAFAEQYGFTMAQWNNYERGSPIPYRAAQSLARKIGGLSVLWILEGDESGLSLDMARKLGLLPPRAS